MVPSDFLLEPELFVDRCVAVFCVSDTVLTAPQRLGLVDALRSGRSRFDVIDAVRSYSELRALYKKRETVTGVGRDLGEHIVTENLASFAPLDDEAFIHELYRAILGVRRHKRRLLAWLLILALG